MKKLSILIFNFVLLVSYIKTSAQVDVSYEIKADLNLLDEIVEI